MKIATTDRRSTLRAGQHNRALARLSLVLAALGFIFGFARPALAGPKPTTTISVLVYNYAEVPRVILTTAERQAFKLLGWAGVRVVWVDCLEKLLDIGSKERCQSGWSAQTPGVRLLSGHVTGMYQDREFGFAAIPVLATVSYEHIERRALRDNLLSDLPIILGCVIAHELGHLLLRDPSHSATGIMQPQWGQDQLHQALTGGLRFTTQQANLIREHALTLGETNGKKYSRTESVLTAPQAIN